MTLPCSHPLLHKGREALNRVRDELRSTSVGPKLFTSKNSSTPIELGVTKDVIASGRLAWR
jgi:hypothetical protein